jgi:hypothetical protein
MGFLMKVRNHLWYSGLSKANGLSAFDSCLALNCPHPLRVSTERKVVLVPILVIQASSIAVLENDLDSYTFGFINEIRIYDMTLKSEEIAVLAQ